MSAALCWPTPSVLVPFRGRRRKRTGAPKKGLKQKGVVTFWVLNSTHSNYKTWMPCIVTSCHYLPVSGLGFLARLLPSLDVVAVSRAPSQESNPNSPLTSENTMSSRVPSCRTPAGLSTFSMFGSALHRRPRVGSPHCRSADYPVVHQDYFSDPDSYRFYEA